MSKAKTTYNIELATKPIKKGENKGRYCVFIRVTYSGQHERHNTGVYVDKKDFNKAARWGQWIRSGSAANDKILQVVESVKAQTLKIDSIENFGAFALRYINDNFSPDESIYHSYKSALNSFILHVGNDFNLQDINETVVRSFVDSRLKEVKGSSVKVILGKLKTMLENSGKTGAHFFRSTKYKIKTVKTKKERLTIDELKKIEEFSSENQKLIEARDIFLFTVHCWGMRIGDACLLRVMDRKDDSINYKMRKNKADVSIKLTSLASEIFDKYSKDKKPEDRIFSYYNRMSHLPNEHVKMVQCDSEVNRQLKRVIKLIGIEKNVSPHVSRHTWAQLTFESMSDKSKAMQIVNKGARHSSISTTEAYLKSLNDDEVDKANENLFN